MDEGCDGWIPKPARFLSVCQVDVLVSVAMIGDVLGFNDLGVDDPFSGKIAVCGRFYRMLETFRLALLLKWIFVYYWNRCGSDAIDINIAIAISSCSFAEFIAIVIHIISIVVVVKRVHIIVVVVVVIIVITRIHHHTVDVVVVEHVVFKCFHKYTETYKNQCRLNLSFNCKHIYMCRLVLITD